MRKLTITLLLLISIGRVWGQSNPLMNWPINIDSTQFRVITIDYNLSDTTHCWFKAAFVVSDSEVMEKWIHGYLVRFPNRSVLLSSIASYRRPSNEFFLWPDKKRFNNTVLAVIEN